MRILLLLVVTLVASCSKQPQPTADTSVLRLNLSDDPVALDPRQVRSLKDLTVVKQLFEGLMRLDAQGIPQPAVAQSVEISDDLLTYTFHLRSTCWSNHDPVTASDFVYAWKKVLDPTFVSDYAYMLYPLKEFTAPDAHTLVVTLHKPTPYFLELTAFPTYFPVHPPTAEHSPHWSVPPADHFVCNGPFTLRHWSPQAELILEKNPTYWDNTAVQLDQIAFSILSDNNTESQLFEKEELDWLGQPISNSIAAELLGKMKREGKLESYGIAGTLWFKFNTVQEPFDNLKIRQAFGYAVNRQELITHVLQGNQAPATGPLPPCMALRSTPYFTDGDTQKAHELFCQGLAEKGWTLETFPRVVLNYAPGERNSKIAQLVQQQWRQALGITVELQSLERQLYERNTKRGLYQVGIGDWIADFNDPLAFLELFKHTISETVSGMNDTGWRDETYISLLDASLLEKDPATRSRLLQQAEQILIQAMPIAPLYHYAFDYIKRPYVHDVILSPLGIADFKTARIHLFDGASSLGSKS